MKTIMISLIFLFSLPAKADGIDSILDEAFYSSLSELGKTKEERDAIKHAQKAFVVVSGLDKSKSNLSAMKNKYINKTKNWAKESLDKDVQSTVVLAAFTYKTIRDKSVQIPISRDFKIDVGIERVKLRIDF